MKILKKVKFSKNQNRMKVVGDVWDARRLFKEHKSKNLRFLLEKRFSWMNNFIKPDDFGIELGTGPGLSKEFINCKNLKMKLLTS